MVAVRGGVAWERPDVVALGVRGVPGGEGSAVMAVVGSSAGGVWGGTYCGGNGEGVEGRRGVVAAGRGPEEPPLWWQWGSPAGVGGGGTHRRCGPCVCPYVSRGCGRAVRPLSSRCGGREEEDHPRAVAGPWGEALLPGGGLRPVPPAQREAGGQVWVREVWGAEGTRGAGGRLAVVSWVCPGF